MFAVIRDMENFADGRELGLREGVELGIELGIVLGIVLGIELGIEQGIELGIEQERYKIVYNMFDELNDSQISNFTQLPMEEIAQIRAEYESNTN